MSTGKGNRKFKRLSFIRSDSSSFKGARLPKNLRKTVSLPTTPLSEQSKLPGDDNNAAVNGGTTTTARERPTTVAEVTVQSGRERKLVRRSTTTGVIEVKQLSSKGVNFLMDTPPAVLSKSRTEKFHKLFKSVPQHEFPIDYYSCAYIGDILLQGNLYVSQNWFCFYSRIRGRGRLLEIPMDSVISITREKTALIFPNAIGLQTKKEKFAFGSFISRDSTYKFIVSMWKKSQELKAAQADESAADNDRGSGRQNRDFLVSENGVDPELDKDLTDCDNGDDLADNLDNIENNNISSVSHSNSKTESTDQSDISVCLECGSVDLSDANDCIKTRDQSDIGETSVTELSARSPVCDKSQSDSRSRSQSSGQNKRVTHHKRRKHIGSSGGLQFPYSVLPYIDRRKTIRALRTSAVKLQRIPRTNLLLAVCTILVLFLLVSSVGLTYKILDLEAKMESQGVWSSGHKDRFRDHTLSNIFYLQSTVKESSAQHMQTILKANIKILEEINANMRTLYQDTKTDSTVTCEQPTEGSTGC